MRKPWGAEGGEVVECRWTFPDGSILPYSGGSSQLTLEPDKVQAGVYRFAVRGDSGVWSEEVGEELDVVGTEFPTEPIIPVVLAAIAVLAAGALLAYYVFGKPPVPEPDPDTKKKKDENESEEDEDRDKRGSIRATSEPSDAVVFVDGAYEGRSPKTIDNVLIGPRTVLFLKRGYFGYEKNAVVIANQTTPVHCDLTKMPEVKLKLSADPAEIVADGESGSTIEVKIVTKDDNEIPIPVPKDTTVILGTDIGTIESPVRIPRGRASGTSTLISPTSSGTATVKAEAECGKIVGTVQKSSDSRTLYLNLTSFSPLLQVVKPFHAGFISDFYHNPRTAHTKLHKSHKNSLFERKEKIATANEGLRHAYNF